MIYIIDDKKSRQEDYGWNEEKLSKFDHILKPIWGNDSLRALEDNIFQAGNTILFHESFPQSDDFKKKLREHSAELNIAYFSGSKGSRYVKGNICMLPPDVLYANLEVFIKNLREGTFNFKHLAFGENFALEELTRSRIIETIKQNRKSEKIPPNKTIFFAVTSSSIDYEIVIDPPFNIEPTRDWDLSFSDKDISDVDLDGLVNGWFAQEKYDAIYIPLCFGNVLSDYLGLRLAMHIRLTPTLNKTTPIFIYGETRTEELINHYCFDVLKLPATFLIECSNSSFFESLKKYDSSNHKFAHDLYLKIPNNLSDSHNVANIWAIYRWTQMIQWDTFFPSFVNDDFIKSLYFKYLVYKFGKHDKFKNVCQLSSPIIQGIDGKSVVYIDDEYYNGWGGLLEYILDKKSHANFIPFVHFDKGLNRDNLVNRIKHFIDNTDADCYIVDLRLHESDFENGAQLTGHEISEYIKEKNRGNQIVIFTASNKIWNLKRDIFETHGNGVLYGELKIGAIDYILKESPELNLKRTDSKQIYFDFCKAIQRACKMSYLKDLIKKQNEMKSFCYNCCQLDSIINLLCLDNGNNDQNILKATLLGEVVFVEDYIKSRLGYDLLATGENFTLKVDLHCKTVQRRVSGHLFFKREQIGEHSVVVDVSPYQETATEPEDGWCNVSKSDVTLISAVMLMELNLDVTIVKKYIDFKKIRNTQIAHRGDSDIKLKTEDIVDFYFSVICSIVEAHNSL